MMKKLFPAFAIVFLFSCGSNESAKESEVKKDSTGTATGSASVAEPMPPATIDTTSTTVVKEDNGSIPLQFNLREGKNYDYNTRFDLSQEGRGMNTTMDVNYDLLVTGENKGVTTVKVTYDRLAMSMNMGTQKMEMSSETEASAAQGPLGMIAGMFRAMKGKSFTMKVKKDGTITDISGFEEIGEAMVKDLQLPEGSAEGIKKNFRNQFNEQTAKESFSNTFSIFPSKPVKVGDSWKKSSNTKVGIAQNMTTTYTVKEIKGNRVTLDAVSNMVMKDSTSGTQTAHLVLDASTGLVTRGTFDQKTAGKMKISSKGLIVGREL